MVWLQNPPDAGLRAKKAHEYPQPKNYSNVTAFEGIAHFAKTSIIRFWSG